MRGTHEKPLQYMDHILVPSDPEQATRGSHDPDLVPVSRTTRAMRRRTPR